MEHVKGEPGQSALDRCDGGEWGVPPPSNVVPFPARPGCEPWLTTAQLAQTLAMSERWIAYRTAEGMPSMLFGRSRRFRISEVEKWLRERQSA